MPYHPNLIRNPATFDNLLTSLNKSYDTQNGKLAGPPG